MDRRILKKKFEKLQSKDYKTMDGNYNQSDRLD